MTEIDFFDVFQGQVATFLLVLTRASGIFFISPFLGSMNISTRFKAGAAVAVAIVLVPVVLIYLLLQRRFIEGVERSGIVG